MSKAAAATALTVLLTISSVGVVIAHEGSGPPPKDLKFVDEHWTPWDPPKPSEGAYIIQKGDTLWDLAEAWLGDAYLWPQIWDENRYILDSHWIYPGDPLVIPGKVTTVPADGPPPGGEEPEVPEVDEPYQEEAKEPVAVRRVAPLHPIADTQDLQCSGYIDVEHTFSDLWIAGDEFGEERVALSEGDVVFLSQGRNQGLQAGDTFGVERVRRDVTHPVSGDRVGTFVRRMGRIRVMIAHENNSTAMVEMSCEDLMLSDELVPWAEIPVPMRRSMPKFERYDTDSKGGSTAHVIYVADDRMSVASGHIIQVDLGVASGVAPGDILTVFRDVEELPRTLVAQAIVLTVEGTTSTVKLTETVREVVVGDRVEVTN
jgi:hypothetical protein